MGEPVILRPPVATGIVPMLTEMLARAKRGEIDQLALVYLETNSTRNDYGVWISDGNRTLSLIGAITDLQYTALRLHNEAQG